jgi:N-acetylmuramoyl-L-alanine amidase
LIRPVPGLALEQQPEAVLRRMCAWAEARSEGALGMLAVLAVVQNRARARKQTEAEVILAPHQFSSFDPQNSQRGRLLLSDTLDPRSWAAADAVAALQEAHATVDPTLGADHYYNPSVDHPAWGRGNPEWKETITIGHHVFGNCP